MALQTRDALAAYLASDELIQSDHEAVRERADRLRGDSDADTAKHIFHFVRDDVAHSWDIQGTRVTRSATDVLTYREGICYAKSHLVAALLRASGIPGGMCYQRLTLLDDDSAGHAVHALNTVWLASLGRWIRIDARGNKPGVAAEFSLDEERLAFKVRPEYDEVDYLVNHAVPHPAIVRVLARHEDALEMYRHRLPSSLDVA
ncbi:MAG TPA: transglutaminase family protein [Candidatus Elarobacter sp.]